MSNEIKYKNNPLNGVSLKKVVTDLSAHYGFDILYAYLNINCFKTNPSIDASVKFLKNTEWAREKVEVFYMYQFKNFPRPSSSQFKLPPRDRIIPDGQVGGAPAILSLEDAEKLKAKRIAKAAEYNSSNRDRKTFTQKKRNSFKKKHPSSGAKENNSDQTIEDPWAHWRK